MNLTAILQARMRSTRLPGKVLAGLAGKSMLARVVERVSRATQLDRLMVATSVLVEDDPVAAECGRLGVACFRGSEEDVLDRFYQAATSAGADAVVRITADCPLIDPEVIDQVAAAFRRERPDYASNTLRRSYPRGLDTEAVAGAALECAWREAREPYERAHVTPFFYLHPERFRLLGLDNPAAGDYEDLSPWRWTVDTEADLEFVEAVYRRMGDGDIFSWRDVCRLIRAEPRLAELNRHVRQKALMEG